MKKVGKLNFVEKKDSQKEIDYRLTNLTMSELKAGVAASTAVSVISYPCDPWSSCDAWNCNPDCICKSSLC
jgi:hypothetical protein